MERRFRVIDTGIADGSMRAVQRFSTDTVSSSERGCVIMEMHIRWNALRAPSRATMSIAWSSGTAGQSTRMKLRSA